MSLSPSLFRLNTANAFVSLWMNTVGWWGAAGAPPPTLGWIACEYAPSRRQRNTTSSSSRAAMDIVQELTENSKSQHKKEITEITQQSENSSASHVNDSREIEQAETNLPHQDEIIHRWALSSDEGICFVASLSSEQNLALSFTDNFKHSFVWRISNLESKPKNEPFLLQYISDVTTFLVSDSPNVDEYRELFIRNHRGKTVEEYLSSHRYEVKPWIYYLKSLIDDIAAMNNKEGRGEISSLEQCEEKQNDIEANQTAQMNHSSQNDLLLQNSKKLCAIKKIIQTAANIEALALVSFFHLIN